MVFLASATRRSVTSSCPRMGGFQPWLTVLAYIATAPVGSPVLLFFALSHASAKQVWLVKLPFTQATETMTGSMLSLVRALTWVLLKPVVTQEVSDPCPT